MVSDATNSISHTPSFAPGSDFQYSQLCGFGSSEPRSPKLEAQADQYRRFKAAYLVVCVTCSYRSGRAVTTAPSCARGGFSTETFGKLLLQDLSKKEPDLE